MENDAATLYCPNELCQAPNPVTHNFCQRCSTPLPKRFLWAVADDQRLGQPGEILDNRYLVISNCVLVDTKPGFVPQIPDPEKLQFIKPYLRLIPYRLHVPEVYGILSHTDGHQNQEILLLEKPPIHILDNTLQLQAQLCSELSTAWSDATSLRQLNWLWQIAHLWQPLASEGVASSLLNSHLIRVEGPLVRLLELQFDKDDTPNLSTLGEFWQTLLPHAKPAIAEYLAEICHSLVKGEIYAAEQLIAVLDQGLAELGHSHSPTITIVTKTDTGPSRQRNEDACYPTSNNLINKSLNSSALTIVCDGIGGHEGGNVASNLAIETIQQQVQELTKVPYDHIDPNLLLEDLQRSVAIANDKISQRNDNESRQGRQRMGTTLVMALAIAHEIYIAHVGDSRAYLITRQGCYQVTLDDDVASREVRLGYAVYRDALQQSASGSLVQALGMSPSSSLHPSAERFVLDDDCIFLLCSDGLSDFDRVEQYWETEILPILDDKIDAVSVADRLIEIANTQNGHDNVTIALVHYQVKYSEPKSKLQAVLPEFSQMPVAPSVAKTLQVKPEVHPSQKNQVMPDTAPSKRRSQVPLQLVIITTLVMLAGLIGVLWRQGVFLTNIPVSTNPTTSDNPLATIPPTPPATNLDSQVIQTTSEIPFITTNAPVKQAIVPSGSVLRIEQPIPDLTNPNSWVYLHVCSVGSGVTSPNQPNSRTNPTANNVVAKPGDVVRMQAAKYQTLQNITAPSPEVYDQCLGSNSPANPVQESPVEPLVTPTPENPVSPQ